MAPVGVSGAVLSINDESDFVIIDLGENSSIQIGDNLSIYRDGQYIAAIEVIQVRKEVSAADIKQKTADIQRGDQVR